MGSAKGNPALDGSFSSARRWCNEADALREVILQCNVTEEMKWGKPCYAHGGKNICIIQRMKDFLALMFFKGALLSDPDNLLEVQGSNSQSAYRMRFTSVDDVTRLAGSIKSFVREAIEAELAGLTVERPQALELPAELVASFQADPVLKSSFDALTPGRKRGYLLHFTGAKQAKTRYARIEKSRRKILEGKGLHD